MSLKLFICVLFLIDNTSVRCVDNEGKFSSGVDLNTAGLTSKVSMFRTISLYTTPINMSLSIYERPIDNELMNIVRVIYGETTIDSTDRCIAFRLFYKPLHIYPFINSQATGNSGCNAILGNKCSQTIRKFLRESSDDINGDSCGVRSLNLQALPECSLDNELTFSIDIGQTLFKNGSFILGDRSKPWAIHESEPFSRGGYDPKKDFILAYFGGRSYNSNDTDVAIACFYIPDYTI